MLYYSGYTATANTKLTVGSFILNDNLKVYKVISKKNTRTHTHTKIHTFICNYFYLNK